jgi:hypothetical protein
VYVTLSWNSNSEVMNLANLRIARFNGTQWKDHGNGGTTGGPASGTITTSAAVTSFSPFTLAGIDYTNPLPIEIINFNAKKQNTQINIEWSVATEVNGKYYSVEKTIDGSFFNEVSRIEISENRNSQIKNYSSIDPHPYSGVSYYRLKAVDLNNSYKYSALVPVVYNDSRDWMVYPTATSDKININLNSDKELSSTIEIQNLAGTSFYKTDSNSNYTSVDISNLPVGLYILNVKNKEGAFTSKIIKN